MSLKSSSTKAWLLETVIGHTCELVAAGYPMGFNTNRQELDRI
jgi:hypothetical protein